MAGLELKFRKFYVSSIRQQINDGFGLFAYCCQICFWHKRLWKEILIPKFWHTEKTIEEGQTIFVCGVSRSGTTLLATILDSHSKISMGYELVPGKIGALEDLLKLLDHGLDVTEGDFRKCGGVIRKSGKKEEGLFLARCHRVGLSADEVQQVFRKLIAEGTTHISTLRERLLVAWRVVERKRELSKSLFPGFKLGPSLTFFAYRHFPGGRFIFILRDPRDVVASQMKRGFDQSVLEICAQWNNCLKTYKRFNSAYPGSCMLIRYEDLITHSLRELDYLFKFLSMDIEERIFSFYDSKASIHQSRHPNSANLKKALFTTSIGRWKVELNSKAVQMILRACGKYMKEYQYLL